jgi:hypothetical protein
MVGAIIGDDDTVVRDAKGRFHDIQGRFVNGNSEREAKKRRIAERLATLRLDYDPSPSQQMLLVVVAGHLDDAERCRSAAARIRATNAARRLLRDIPRKPPPGQLMTARELLDKLRP